MHRVGGAPSPSGLGHASQPGCSRRRNL